MPYKKISGLILTLLMAMAIFIPYRALADLPEGGAPPTPDMSGHNCDDTANCHNQNYCDNLVGAGNNGQANYFEAVNCKTADSNQPYCCFQESGNPVPSSETPSSGSGSSSSASGSKVCNAAATKEANYKVEDCESSPQGCNDLKTHYSSLYTNVSVKSTESDDKTVCPSVCCVTYGQDKAATPAASTAATAPKPPAVYALANPLGKDVTFVQIIGRIIKAFLGITGAIALAVFVFGGIMWMTARGDAGQVKKAQDAIKYGAIGLILIMFSYVLAGGFVNFWITQKQEVEQQEGRTTTEAPTASSNKQADINSQKQQTCDTPYTCFSVDDKSHVDTTQLSCTGKTCTAGLAQGECCQYKTK